MDPSLAKEKKILEDLQRLSRNDMDPSSGYMWGHSYEHGLKNLKQIVEKAYLLYLEKNMLDPTVYPSIIKLENDVVEFVARYFNTGQKGAGTFTSGGTESIMLAILAATKYYEKKYGKKPELVLPITAHPAFHKAAFYLGLRTKVIPVDNNYMVVEPEVVAEALEDTATIVAISAPNYPYGSIDPVESIAKQLDERVWIHVDACIGFILPFLELLGENIEPYDFRVSNLYSISTDLHKYGYVPKGASVILYRDKNLRLFHYYAYSRWPGYPLVNTTVLSSRTAGGLAASWATIRFLGEDGYVELARRVLETRKILENRIVKIGYKVVGKPQAGILAFSSESIDIYALADIMRSKGWYVQVQPGSIELGIEPSIHLTIAPIHYMVVEKFLEDLEEATKEAEKVGRIDVPIDILRWENEEEVWLSLPRILELVGVSRGKLPKEGRILNMLINRLPPEIVEYALKYAVNEIYTASRR